jgi:hypothetical protein
MSSAGVKEVKFVITDNLRSYNHSRSFVKFQSTQFADDRRDLTLRNLGQ